MSPLTLVVAGSIGQSKRMVKVCFGGKRWSGSVNRPGEMPVAPSVGVAETTAGARGVSPRLKRVGSDVVLNLTSTPFASFGSGNAKSSAGVALLMNENVDGPSRSE